jgi:hypothetical protein
LCGDVQVEIRILLMFCDSELVRKFRPRSQLHNSLVSETALSRKSKRRGGEGIRS